MLGAKPYGRLQYREGNGKRMDYVDEGQGDASPRPVVAGNSHQIGLVSQTGIVMCAQQARV
jgi:hypothetical protein